MPSKTKQWTTGTGSATIQYGGQGDGEIIVTSDANNLYEPRSMQIVVETTDGSGIQRALTVNQAAKQRIDISNADAIASLQTDKANKSEMAINDVTGDDTKKEIVLKSGTSQQVLVAHQSLTGKQDKITASGILKGDGNGGVTAATADTDYQTPIVFNTAYNASTNKAATMSDVPQRVTAQELATFVV